MLHSYVLFYGILAGQKIQEKRLWVVSFFLSLPGDYCLSFRPLFATGASFFAVSTQTEALKCTRYRANIYPCHTL